MAGVLRRDRNHSCWYFAAREAEALRDRQPARSAARAVTPVLDVAVLRRPCACQYALRDVVGSTRAVLPLLNITF